MNFTNFTIAAFIAIATTFFCPCGNHDAAADSTTTDFSVEIATRNMFRGSQGGTGPYVFPSLTIPLSNNIGGTTFNLYGQYAVAGELEENEIDFTLGQEIGDIATVYISSYYYGGSLVDLDNHNVDLFLTSDYFGFDITLSRMVYSNTVEGDSYVELGYTLGDFDLFAGVGDGSYSDNGDFAPVNVGFTYNLPIPRRRDDTDQRVPRWGERPNWGTGYSASFVYNPSTETPYFVVSKRW